VVKNTNNCLEFAHFCKQDKEILFFSQINKKGTAAEMREYFLFEEKNSNLLILLFKLIKIHGFQTKKWV
jgi:hypothetical protein